MLAMCGDGATSEGDFHEAMNFAAVFQLPVVFFVQNNEFAISVPLSRQTRGSLPSPTRASATASPASSVDGNDLAALLAVLDAAVSSEPGRAVVRSIEAHTYRMQATPTPTTTPATGTPTTSKPGSTATR